MPSEEKDFEFNVAGGLLVQADYLAIESLPLGHVLRCRIVEIGGIGAINETEILFVLNGAC